MNLHPKFVFQAILLTLVGIQAAIARPLSFQVVLDPSVQQKPFTGRIYVVISKNRTPEPRKNLINWLHLPAVFAMDVVNIKPGETITVRPSEISSPVGIKSLEPGEYNIQAVARRNIDVSMPGQAPGDLYSEAQWLSTDSEKPTIKPLRINQIVQSKPFRETRSIKLFEMHSEVLSKFHKRPVMIRAGVVLPNDWMDEAKSQYPILYWVPGFGGSHRSVSKAVGFHRSAEKASSVMIVVPDPNCYYGHSVFADSETNGPWGTAFMTELIPAIEKQFHGPRSGAHRYIAGISSGGWSSLWLQIKHPDSFNGCWAHAPDPVDFRDFLQINLYDKGSNMYVDSLGERRPLARDGEKVMLWLQDIARYEYALGPGGAVQTFDGAFSKCQLNGKPDPLFDRITGDINPSVAKSWEKFDIRLTLEQNWKALSAKLAGKLHIYCGDADNFYLNCSVELLKASLAKLGSDADVQLIPGMGHTVFKGSLEPMFDTIKNNFDRNKG